MNKTCAICGKTIYSQHDICVECMKYNDTQWAKELIQIERHNNYMERKHPEIPFSDLTPKHKK